METQTPSDSDPSPDDRAEAPFGSIPEISEALGQLQEKLRDLESATAHIEKSQKAATDASEAANKVRSAAADLVESTGELVERIDDVDFPSRLDEIEDSVEENGKQIAGFKSEVNDHQEKIAGAFNSLKEDLSTVKTQLLVGLSVVGLIAFAILLLLLV